MGLSTLGIDAKFRPRNDIEVNGQKISGTGGFFDGNTLMFQGTVLIDLSPDVMMSVLNVPQHKLDKHDLEKAAQRVTCLRALLGEAPSMEAVQAALLAGFEKHLGFDMVAGAISEGRRKTRTKPLRRGNWDRRICRGNKRPCADAKCACRTKRKGKFESPCAARRAKVKPAS